MNSEELISICCSDIAGQVRGKAVALDELSARQTSGVGWTPTNIMITAHRPIGNTPWGPYGDLILRPDMKTHTHIATGLEQPAVNFVLADICNTDGTPWGCCPRDFLRRALEALETEAGLRLKSAFEHEFHYDGAEERPNSSYGFGAFRAQGDLAGTLFWALRQAGIEPETFMAEYGPCQYEIAVGPKLGIAAADTAVVLREVTRICAERLGHRVSFTPILDPDSVGNGVHMHFSLEDLEGTPVGYDAAGPGNLSKTAGAFVAGILEKLPALCALTAPSTISYLRLTPNRWSASYNNLGRQDREAAVRICPLFETSGKALEQQFNLEYRAADAAASPYLALGAIVWAGILGLRKGLPMPLLTTVDPATMSDDERAAHGLRRLPESLSSALDLLEADTELQECLGAKLADAYLRHKRFEIEVLKDDDWQEQCRRYQLVY